MHRYKAVIEEGSRFVHFHRISSTQPHRPRVHWENESSQAISFSEGSDSLDSHADGDGGLEEAGGISFGLAVESMSIVATFDRRGGFCVDPRAAWRALANIPRPSVISPHTARALRSSKQRWLVTRA